MSNLSGLPCLLRKFELVRIYCNIHSVILFSSTHCCIVQILKVLNWTQNKPKAYTLSPKN